MEVDKQRKLAAETFGRQAENTVLGVKRDGLGHKLLGQPLYRSTIVLRCPPLSRHGNKKRQKQEKRKGFHENDSEYSVTPLGSITFERDCSPVATEESIGVECVPEGQVAVAGHSLTRLSGRQMDLKSWLASYNFNGPG